MSSPTPEQNPPEPKLPDLSLAMSPDELRWRFETMYDAAARDIFCVLSKDGRSTLMNPGLNRPWTSKNRKQADLVAKENGGIVVDMDTAIRKNFAALTARN